ncbi:MAG: ankyrin repeat domain-containing protein, partial [Pirellulales bacterium]|nr:ankyrin repeat domain-containing protein [Pirellulales bacterium]
LIDCVELLINLGANINEKDGEGWTALHLSSNSGKIELVKLLIDKGADINAQEVDGENPLNRAENDKPMSALLRKHGGKTGEELKAAGN